MGIIVQKYGGSSVATAEHIRAVAGRVGRAKDSGFGPRRDRLGNGEDNGQALEARGRGEPGPFAARDRPASLDGEVQSVALLAMALHDMGVAAVSLTGPQAGMTITGRYGSGVISEIRPERVHRLLNEGQVVIVAGFQGVNSFGDIMTLGRGGSDTTAVALAAAMGAERCEIFTDVDGVYTADPRIVREARRIPVISPEEMAEMSWRGAKVMHPRAVELGALYGVEIHVRPPSGKVLARL